MRKQGSSDRVGHFQAAEETRRSSAHTSTTESEPATSLAPPRNQSQASQNQARAARSSFDEGVAQLASAPQHDADALARIEAILLQILASSERRADIQHRILERLNPAGGDRLVGTPYVAKQLGLCTRSVCDMACNGTIPPDCIAVRSGNGKRWKFNREAIDAWVEKQAKHHR